MRSPIARTHGTDSSRRFQASSEPAAGPEHAVDLGQGADGVEPVERLGDDDRVDRGRGQRDRLGGAVDDLDAAPRPRRPRPASRACPSRARARRSGPRSARAAGSACRCRPRARGGCGRAGGRAARRSRPRRPPGSRGATARRGRRPPRTRGRRRGGRCRSSARSYGQGGVDARPATALIGACGQLPARRSGRRRRGRAPGRSTAASRRRRRARTRDGDAGLATPGLAPAEGVVVGARAGRPPRRGRRR